MDFRSRGRGDWLTDRASHDPLPSDVGTSPFELMRPRQRLLFGRETAGIADLYHRIGSAAGGKTPITAPAIIIALIPREASHEVRLAGVATTGLAGSLTFATFLEIAPAAGRRGHRRSRQ